MVAQIEKMNVSLILCPDFIFKAAETVSGKNSNPAIKCDERGGDRAKW